MTTAALRAAVLIGDTWRIQGPFSALKPVPYQAVHLVFELGKIRPEEARPQP